ncbi:palmdelphin isoform X2 [Ambystoma mexicanum]|uniref:palmdelphin isoform X2 n=1 Tax=Ambystoma mexicanum TaxID=8296 RepID=UPI0037E8193F
MEEAELLRERLQAITDKRKLQEEITQKRLKLEEEKLKLQHLKKKALREKWLLDGVSALTAKEQENMQRQNQEDQQLSKLLSRNILRLDQEIEDLERQELQVSAKEVRVLKKLKSVERTSEDIIRAVKAEVREADYTYSNIPDLPKSYRPSRVKRGIQEEENDGGEENRKALFAMEIKVEKDMKTGESTVLSSIPFPSEEFKNTGVKVYDDGRKSVYALSSPTQNGVDNLAPVEVEDLLRQATEKNATSPTEYHNPVFSYEYSSSPTPVQTEYTSETSTQAAVRRNPDLVSPSQQSLIWAENGHECKENGLGLPQRVASPLREPSQPEEMTQNNLETKITHRQEADAQEESEAYPGTSENYREAMFTNSQCANGRSSAGFEEDVKYSLVHAMPCYVDDSEPVTMIFMGYQHVDDEVEQNQKLSNFDGIIRAELVVIDDEDDEDDKVTDLSEEAPSYPIAQQDNQATTQTDVRQKSPVPSVKLNMNTSPYRNSISLQEQQATLGQPVCHSLPDGHLLDDGTEDPSLTALRIRMAKLGKRVI